MRQHAPGLWAHNLDEMPTKPQTPDIVPAKITTISLTAINVLRKTEKLNSTWVDVNRN